VSARLTVYRVTIALQRIISVLSHVIAQVVLLTLQHQLLCKQVLVTGVRSKTLMVLWPAAVIAHEYCKIDEHDVLFCHIRKKPTFNFVSNFFVSFFIIIMRSSSKRSPPENRPYFCKHNPQLNHSSDFNYIARKTIHFKWKIEFSLHLKPS